MPLWVDPILSGVLAAGLSFLELVVSLRRTPTWRATHWIAIRLLFDVAAGSLAYGVLELAFGDVKWFTGLWPILIAGLSGPALLRSQLALFGSGLEAAHFGPAVVFASLQRAIDRRIADLEAVEESRWKSREVIPKLVRIPLVEVERMIVDYLEYPGHLEGDQSAHIQFIKVTLADEASPVDVRCSAVVSRVLQLGGRRLIKEMIRNEKRMTMTSHDSAAGVSSHVGSAETVPNENPISPNDQK